MSLSYHQAYPVLLGFLSFINIFYINIQAEMNKERYLVMKE